MPSKFIAFVGFVPMPAFFSGPATFLVLDVSSTHATAPPCPDVGFYRISLYNLCLIDNVRPISRAMDCIPIPTDALLATNSVSSDESAGAVCVAFCKRTRRQCVPIMVTTHDTLSQSSSCAQSLSV